MGRKSFTTPLALALTLLGACEDKAELSKSAPPAKPAAEAGKVSSPESATPKADFSGTVTGSVKLVPGATLPMREVDATQHVFPGCPPISDEDRRTIQQNAATQGLSPVHVAITGMTTAPERAPITHDITIENCRLTPKLIAVMRGDKLRVTNKSSEAFLPVLPADPFMQAILPGNSREREVDRLGPVSIQCGFAGYCGETLALSAGHTLYAVTDGEGRFKINGIPLDQDLVLHAWHPLFEASSQPFKLTRAESTRELALELKPAAPPPAPAPQAAAGKPAAKALKKTAQPGK